MDAPVHVERCSPNCHSGISEIPDDFHLTVYAFLHGSTFLRLAPVTYCCRHAARSPAWSTVYVSGSHSVVGQVALSWLRSVMSGYRLEVVDLDWPSAGGVLTVMAEVSPIVEAYFKLLPRPVY